MQLMNNIQNDEIATYGIGQVQSNTKYEEIASTSNDHKKITFAADSLLFKFKDFEKAIDFDVEKQDEVTDEEEENSLDNFRVESAETVCIPNLP